MKKILYVLILAVLACMMVSGCAYSDANKGTAEASASPSTTEAQTSAKAKSSPAMRPMTDTEKEDFREILDQTAERYIVLQSEAGYAKDADGINNLVETINNEPMFQVNDPRFKNLEELQSYLGETISKEYPPYADLLDPEKASTALYREVDGKLYVRIVAAVYSFSEEIKDKGTYLMREDGQEAEIQLPAALTDAVSSYRFQKEPDGIWRLYASGSPETQVTDSGK